MPAVMPAFPDIDAATTKTYRRVYRNLQYVAAPGKYTADSITGDRGRLGSGERADVERRGRRGVPEPTRYNIAKQGLSAAVAENASSTFRWGLIKLRQNTPAWRTGANCDKPVLGS